MRIHKVFDYQGSPNNIEAWVQDQEVICICDYPISYAEIHAIEDALKISHIVGWREKYHTERLADGKYLFSWKFLESCDVDYS